MVTSRMNVVEEARPIGPRASSNSPSRTASQLSRLGSALKPSRISTSKISRVDPLHNQHLRKRGVITSPPGADEGSAGARSFETFAKGGPVWRLRSIRVQLRFSRGCRSSLSSLSECALTQRRGRGTSLWELASEGQTGVEVVEREKAVNFANARKLLITMTFARRPLLSHNKVRYRMGWFVGGEP
jgi:hypothetical protein